MPYLSTHYSPVANFDQFLSAHFNAQSNEDCVSTFTAWPPDCTDLIKLKDLMCSDGSGC